MIKKIKKLTAGGLAALMLLSLLVVTALAAGGVTLDLSKTSGYAGDSVTISGTAAPGQWVSIKAVDADGNLVYFSAAVCDGTGAYSDTWVVPDVPPGTLQVIAGYGGDVASTVFTVQWKPTPWPGTPPGTGSSGTASGDLETIVITDNSGNFATGTMEMAGESKATISREAFDEFARISDGPATVDMIFCVITFSPSAVDAISAAGAGDISLTVKPVDSATLNGAAQALVGSRPVFDFSLAAGSTPVSELGGTATVQIPYTPDAGEDFNAVVIYYVDSVGSPVPVRGRYDPLNGIVEFTVSHFSVYAVGYNKVTFDDVAVGDWYYHAVTFCAAREITNGTGYKLFSPDAALTRGQFLVMLMRAYGLEADAYDADNFDDAGDTYYTGYLSAAKRLGISNGVGNNLYAPERQISRQDMFTLVYRALGVLGEWPEADGAGSLSDFGDAGLVADYAHEAMEMLYRAGVISGSGGELDPLGSTTRAHMAQVLYNLLTLQSFHLKPSVC